MDDNTTMYEQLKEEPKSEADTKTLHLQHLKDMQPGVLISRGTTVDSVKGLNITGTGQQLKWVAVRGDIHDWAIYAGPATWTDDNVKRMGDKVYDPANIRKLVPCDDEALNMYRR